MRRNLIDAFRHGAVPAVIRRKGASGDLPVPLAEKIEILAFLASDPKEPVHDQAFETLRRWDADELRQVLSDPATSPEVLDFAMNQLLYGHEELIETLIQNPSLLAGGQQELEEGAIPVAPHAAGANDRQHGESASERLTMLQRISRMSVAAKIRAALLGSQEERMILIRDSNKAVARAVLQSPKISEMEIETYATMTSLTEEILRLISTNRAFVRHYPVVRALANNPRVPIDVTLPLLNHLNDRDLKALAVNKNVPDALRQSAGRKHAQRRGR